jgi:hypothetical protein
MGFENQSNFENLERMENVDAKMKGGRLASLTPPLAIGMCGL